MVQAVVIQRQGVGTSGPSLTFPGQTLAGEEVLCLHDRETSHKFIKNETGQLPTWELLLFETGGTGDEKKIRLPVRCS